MRMNTRAMKKLRSTLTNPMKSSRKRLSLGMLGALERSRIIKPRPPIVNRKLDASPSIMYWPFTLENTSIGFSFKSLDCVLIPKILHAPVGQEGNRSLVSMLISHWTHTRWLYDDVVDDTCAVNGGKKKVEFIIKFKVKSEQWERWLNRQVIITITSVINKNYSKIKTK